MTFSWLGFIIGFLSAMLIFIAISRLGQFIRFAIISKQYAKMKGGAANEGSGLEDIFKGQSGPPFPGGGPGPGA